MLKTEGTFDFIFPTTIVHSFHKNYIGIFFVCVMFCAQSCSFQKNNHRMALTESLMMATSPIVQYNPYHGMIPGEKASDCKVYPLAPTEQKELDQFLKENLETVMTSTDSGFTAVIGYSQYLIMPKHLSKELAEPMNINWKTSSQVSTGLRMDKCQSSNIVVSKLKTS